MPSAGRPPANMMPKNAPGPRGVAKEKTEPIDCVELFFDNEAMQLILENTNAYYESKKNKKIEAGIDMAEFRKKSPWWREINDVDLKGWFAFEYVRGLLGQTMIDIAKLYDTAMGHPIYRSVMSPAS